LDKKLKIERYRQITLALIAELQSGKYKKGDTLPVRSELARHFKTTRSTVNRAMEELINKGFLTARRGAGTVVLSLENRLNIAYVAPKWLMHYMPRPNDCKLIYFPAEEIFTSRSSANKLSRFDGIIWSHPEVKDIPQITKISAGIPLILVNRISDGINSVISEYVESFSKHVSECLTEHPDATPCFLSSSESSTPYRKRHEGFVKACREHKRFYENIELPKDFMSKQSCLENGLVDEEKELLIFADNWAHTGALIDWARKHKRQFGKDIFYTDFDNTEPEHVWGITTTSIIQDFDSLTETAFELLLDLIKQTDTPKNIFIAPELRHGNT
jgi:Bacterial regulatory proteins, gntR family/Periplasmic binding protein-like domain